MTSASRFLIAANDEHGQFPPTAGKRTPVMPFVNRSFFENQFNRPAKYYFLLACLRCGFNVFDAKPEINDVPVAQRVARVNAAKCDCLVTFAYNAAGNATEFSQANGFRVFYSSENRFASASRLLSYDLSNGLAKEITVRNNGIATLAGIGVLRSVNCPAALAECGFMTNFQEAKLMVDPDFQKRCGEGACRGVCAALDAEYINAVCYTSLPILQRGSRNAGVKYLQCLLDLYGDALTPDGVFGSGTLSAVKTFQQNNGLAADGIVGPATWRTLTMQSPLPTLRMGSKGVFVRYLQQKLLAKLYPVGTIDGVFGKNTFEAVQQFQQENALVADGIVGKNTWSKLTPIGGGRTM